MIKRLNFHNSLDLQIFLEECFDRYSEFFITKDKQRYFLKNNSQLITEVLKKQEIYGFFEDGLKGILLIFREKGFRPYLKILAKSNKVNKDLVKFFLWNFMKEEVYCKVKKANPLFNILVAKAFYVLGNRGTECLLIKKAIKGLKPFIQKDDFIDHESLYVKRKK